MLLEYKRHLCLLAAAFVFGTVLYSRKEDVWLPVLFLLGMVLLYGIATGRKRTERVIVFWLVFATALAAFLVCSYQDRSYDRILAIPETDPGTSLNGTVYKKEIRSDRCLYYLNSQYKKVIVYFDTDDIPIGSEVKVRGNLRTFSHATNEGSFDLAEDYRNQNITFRVFADDMSVQKEPAIRFREGLYQLQKQISAVFWDSLNEREAGVLSMLTVGNRGGMDPDVRRMYQKAGISHILAISGMHISILGFGVYRFLRRIRVPCHLCELLGCLTVFCFVVMSGMGISALRALVMYLLMMGARASGRTYDPLNALAVAALTLLIPNPANLYRSGFQFSFLAMSAIVLFGAVNQKIVERRDKRKAGNAKKKEEKERIKKICRSLRERVFFGAFMQLAILPLLAWYYYEVPLYATFLNLLILPLCGMLLGFGLAGGVLGIFLPQAAKWLLIPCHVILRIYEGSVRLIGRLPLASWITGKPSAWMLLLFYLTLVGVCVLYLSKADPAGILRNKTLCRITRGNLIKRYGLTLTAFLGCILFCILFLPERQICRVDFLDVGQGDGIFLTDGEGTRVMIDGGSSSESSVGAYEIEPFLKYHGIRKVDAWILTHGDSDHYSGLLEALEDGYGVDCLVLADAMPRDETWAKLVLAAGENGTEVVYVMAGDGIALKDCEMTCLYPSAEEGKGTAADGETKISDEDANEFSQVWLFKKEDMSVMFTGDLGEEQERILIDRGVLSDCTILKVAHHGSKYSSCAEFLEVVSPEYAVISCGENNIYGHPAPETLERLVDAGCEIWQTPQSGQITAYEKRRRWKVHTYCSDP